MSAVGDFAAAISLTRVVGMALLAFGLGLVVSMLYRAYLNARAPSHVSLIIGLGAVGLWMNTASAIVAFIASTTVGDPLVLNEMETNATALGVSAIAALAGARVGDQLAPNLRALTGATSLDTEVNKLVRSVGRFTTVKVPKVKDIHDMEDFEPVPEETKTRLGGTQFLFPQKLTVEELRRRFVKRLREDFSVGYVDVELSDTGTIEFLAIGSRLAGIGPTLPPRKAAIAVDTTSTPTASPGDRIRVWRLEESGDENGNERHAERVTTAELRGSESDTATLLVENRNVRRFDLSETYRLVTLSADAKAEREFATLLRTAHETMETIAVRDGSPLLGMPLGALRGVVVAMSPSEGPVVTLPSRWEVCTSGDILYIVARPDQLRKLERAASPESTEPTVPSEAEGLGDRLATDHAGQPLRSRFVNRLRRLGRRWW